jgi:hypothetical protein
VPKLSICYGNSELELKFERLQQTVVNLDEKFDRLEQNERSGAQSAAASLQVLCTTLLVSWQATELSFSAMTRIP